MCCQHGQHCLVVCPTLPHTFGYLLLPLLPDHPRVHTGTTPESPFAFATSQQQAQAAASSAANLTAAEAAAAAAAAGAARLKPAEVRVPQTPCTSHKPMAHKRHLQCRKQYMRPGDSKCTGAPGVKRQLLEWVLRQGWGLRRLEEAAANVRSPWPCRTCQQRSAYSLCLHGL